MASVEGGNKLGAALSALASKLGDATSVDVGFLENATYPDGTRVAMVAAIQEFGAPRVGIPPRPFFRTMISKKSGEWPKAVADLLVANDFDAAKTLDQAGAAIKGQLQQSIVETNDPPLSPVTLMVRQIVGPNGTPTFADVMEARRRVDAGEVAQGVASKPLVWTGNLLNSVDYRVK